VSNANFIRPQSRVWKVIHGVDYGQHMKLFVYNDRYALLLRPGHSWYRGRLCGTGYAPTMLFVFDVRRGYTDCQLAEGGRFDIERVKSFREKIDTLFGEGTTDMLEWNATYVLATGDRPWMKIIDPQQWAANEAQKKADAKDRRERKAREREARNLRFKKSI